MLKITDIQPYANNAKKHPEKQLDQLASIVKEVGWRQPVLVNQKGTIIVGHGRWMTWQKYKKELKPIWVIDDKGRNVSGKAETSPMTIQQEKAYRLADNKLNESDWDMQLVTEELKDLDPTMLDLTGFSGDLVLEPDEKDEAIPDSAPCVAKFGDVWALGRHRLMCGDATADSANVGQLMGQAKADMVFTDPPYNVDYTGKTEKALKIKNDKMADDAFLQFLVASFKNMAEHSKKGTPAYVCHSDTEGLNFRRAFVDAGFVLKQTIIWVKNAFVLGRQDYQWQHEPILYGWQEGKSHNWYGSRADSTVWEIDRPVRNEEHPTMKPVELVTKAVLNSSKEEDIILDLFGGSGTTLIASEKTNRICYMMELDPKYCDVIIKRWEDYTGNKAKKLSNLGNGKKAQKIKKE